MTEKSIANFLKQLRKTSTFSANRVVEKLKQYNIDISAKTLYGYESGLSMPNADAFVALCKIYKCENPMDMLGGVSIKPAEVEIIEKYRSLDDYGRETVDIVLDRESERAEQQKKRLITYEKALNKLRNNKSQDNYPNMVAESSFTYGTDAAHGRTDIEVTDDMKKHDDDIMDDDNF